MSAGAQHNRQLARINVKALDQSFGGCVVLGIQQLMRMTVAAQKALEPKHVAIFGSADNDRSARAAFEDGDPAQDQGPHDAFAKFSFGDHQRAQPLRRNNERLHGLLSDCIHQRRAAGQLRQFAHKVARAGREDRFGVAQIVLLGDRDLAREDDHQAGSDLPACHQRFTGRIGPHLAEAAHALNIQRIERGKNLIRTLLANG